MKAYLATVLEDLVGEYVINVSKENLKLAALRGRIKLENVELDGDFIGSHILGPVGLSGFGVLSCWAHTLEIVIPWTNLDAPTSLEIRGMHLVCVPLLPTTANRTYFGSQTLRTRAKRASLARFERNFFSGRIPGEGPQQEADQNDGENSSYNGRRRRWSSSEDIDGEQDFGECIDSSANAIEMKLTNSMHKDSRQENSSPTKKEKRSGLPALRKKIKAKIYENLVSSVTSVHIRCEIPNEGLNMSLPKHPDSTSESNGDLDQRAFAFGLTLHSLSVRNMSEGESPKKNSSNDGYCKSQTNSVSTPCQDGGRSSPSDSENKTNKKIEIEGLAIYWDDGPSFLISESDLLNGHFMLPVATSQRRIAQVMKGMTARQDPGFDARISLSQPRSPAKDSKCRAKDGPDHDYICSDFSHTMLTTLASDASENSLCFAEFLPCRLDLNFTSQQYKQYQLLKNAVLSQQRFDTMLHRRPQKTPLEDPRSWWEYAIACVKHKPTSRPWEDVQKIVQCRKSYLELVVKNLSSDPEKGGFHGGLTDDESNTLLELEDMLPIETLISFHLLALRRVTSNHRIQPIRDKAPKRASLVNSFTRKHSSSIGRLLNSIAGSSNSWQSLDDECPNQENSLPMIPSPKENGDAPVMMPKQRTTSSYAVKTPTSQTTCQLHICKVRVTLLESVDGGKIVTVEFDIKGTSYTSGTGKADLTFDMIRFEVFDYVTCDDEISSGGKVLVIEPDKQDFDCKSTVIENDFGDNDLNILHQPSFPTPSSLDSNMDEMSVMRLLPKGVVCRVTAVLDHMSLSLNLTAHPATIIWNKMCADSVADFFLSSTHQIQIDLARQLRNVTTPVAHRAQMAVLYPTSLSVNIDAHAPKLWIPVSPQMLDGALFIDTGKLKMTLKKAEQSSETSWDADVADIQIMLAGETSGTVLGGIQNDVVDLEGVSHLVKELTTIVHPFQIKASGHTMVQIDVTDLTMESFEVPSRTESTQEGTSPANNIDTQTEAGGQISVNIGRIRLNLVDVEELAKAIGKFYASGVVMMKTESASRDSLENIGDEATHGYPSCLYPEASAFEIVHVCFDKLEMALERYSSQRTYLVEIYSIKLEKKKANVSFSRLSISDLTIVQLSDASRNRSNSNVRYLKPSTEPQHQLLGRIQTETQHNMSEVGSSTIESSKDISPASQPSIAPQTPRRKGKSSTPMRTPKKLRFTSKSVIASPTQPFGETRFIRGCHFHDGENHIDEVEFDVASVIVKVTPASISDCAMWLARAFELIRVASKEMERRVHERGRKSRTEDKKGEGDLTLTPSKSEGISASLIEGHNMTSDDEERSSSRGRGLENSTIRPDSSIIFRVTFKDAHILVGRPASEFVCSRGRQPTDYVVQILTNASIMTQSIENQNGTGSRTFHISMEDFSASVNPDFRHVNASDATPILSPAAVDCRIVYHTVGEGYASFQDFSFDCESMAWKMAPHDIRVVSSVARKVTERLQLLQTTSGKKAGSSQSAIVHSQKKGSRIATRIRLELQSCSFILIRSFKSKASLRPFIEINANQLKVCLEGCIDALSGEVVALAQVKFYNPRSNSWEDIIQSNSFIMAVDQIPNELVLSISSPDVIHINLTGVLIQEFAHLERTSRYHNNSELAVDTAMKALQSRYSFVNETGIEVSLGFKTNGNSQLEIEQDSGDNHINVPSGSIVTLDSSITQLQDSCSLSLGANDRGRALHNLPLFQTSLSKQSHFFYKWHPHNTDFGFASHRKDRGDIEPVVEFVMQNERIRPGITDVSYLERAQDLLESKFWPPVLMSSHDKLRSDSLWLRPYLKDDACEWSDMTNVINTKKDEFVLPDKYWMWVNDWEVEVNSDLGINDTDGWEYAADFETFSTRPRSYQRGDLCRRRRWTRTRMVKYSQSATDRVLPIVWEVGTEENGSMVKARSHLQVHNATNIDLSFFGFCHSWNEDEYIGNAAHGSSLCVPLQLATATHIRLATPKKTHDIESSPPTIDMFFVTEQLMILPTGFNSNRIIHASILCEHNVGGFLSIKKLHFLITLKSVEGVVDIHVEPALKIINLLPCQLQCQLGEIGCSVRIGTRKISQTEVLSLDSGKEGKCLSVDCCLSPHISVRLPGYKWSYWKRIVNRESNSHTWRPTEDEELALFDKDSAEHATESKSIVHFDHKCSGGNSLNIIMSIEMGHSPTLRLYAQFWLLDKSGLGLNFSGGFSDLLQTTPEMETLRKSHLLPIEANDRSLKLDMDREGHEWSLGMSGMTLFFSNDEKITLSVEGDTGGKSQWTSLIDVSNAMPETVKTAISIDQYHGTRRYEIAYNITLCPSIFARTRLITFFPRYQIVNLLQGESLYIAQDGALGSEMCIPPQSSVLFHWENSSLDPKIRICSEFGSWSRGCIELDKIGVTAMRIPSSISAKPMVVQAEVRLATKKEDSAIVVTISASIQNMNPLYLLKNVSQHTIFCRQELNEEGYICDDGFIWTLNSGESVVFGFDDPEVPHVLQWTWSNTSRFVSTVEVDAMGSKSTIVMWDGSELVSEIQAQQSTKVILFSETAPVEKSKGDADNDEEDIIGITIRIDLSGINVSVIDNVSDFEPGREILLLTTEGWHASFSQSREGFHEMELRLKSTQVDNFIFNAEHPVLIFCPSNEDIPFLHISAVRSMQEHSGTLVLSYIALRILDIDVCLDRKTAEKVAQFLHPLRKARDEQNDINWTSTLTSKMRTRYSNPSRLPRAPRDVHTHTANSGRVYLEKLHLHPLRLSLTFTQEGLEWNPVTEGLMVFQLIRGMASIADAPLIFTSFIVSHAFESPETLFGIILAHYSSQLSSQILTILGSLVIFSAPADILSNVGTGVRDFFYEPINGLVHGPAEFIEGLESGTSSLVRGLAAGLVRGATTVTELVSHNLANLTDDVFIDERNVFQKKFMHALKSDEARRTIQDSLAVAGTCLAIGFRSGANGIFEQPSIYASRHGTAGLVKGVGKAFVGALVKPVVGVGDAAVVVMNHVTDTTINKLAIAKNNKRMRRALPCTSSESGSGVRLIPYDDKSARVQQIVTSGETRDDAYLGHIQTPNHTIIASDQFLWIIGEKSNGPRRIRWAEISNFGIYGNQMQIDVFSGPSSFTFEMSSLDLTDLYELLLIRMGNSSNSTDLDLSQRGTSYSNLPGIKSIQLRHVFGSVNGHLMMDANDLNDETKFINGSYTRVNRTGSFMPNFFQRLDQEAWLLISCVRQMFTGLSSRRCISAGMINGTGDIIQVVSIKLTQGGSPCYTIPSIEYDKNQGVLYPGGAIIFFGWGAVPSLLQPGKVLMHIETNVFVSDLSDSLSQSTSLQVLPTWQVDFLEKSYDESEWWAKYWMLVQKKKTG